MTLTLGTVVLGICAEAAEAKTEDQQTLAVMRGVERWGQDEYRRGRDEAIAEMATRLSEARDERAFTAYSAWAKARAKAGITSAPWPNMLQEDKSAWLAVYEACADFAAKKGHVP